MFIKHFLYPVPRLSISFVLYTYATLYLQGRYYVGEEDQEEAADDDSKQPHDIKPFAIDTATISLRQFFMFLGRTAHISHAEKVGYSLVLAAFAEKSLLPKEDDAKLEWIKGTRACRAG